LTAFFGGVNDRCLAHKNRPQAKALDYPEAKGKYGEMIIKIIPANATERWCYERV
jgi:hypothetical protein